MLPYGAFSLFLTLPLSFWLHQQPTWVGGCQILLLPKLRALAPMLQCPLQTPAPPATHSNGTSELR